MNNPSSIRRIVVTPCAARKRIRPALSIVTLPSGTQSEVTECWLEAASKATPVAQARDLYCGRAFGLSVEAAEVAGADLGILSAGLGFLDGATCIPSYDLAANRDSAASVQRHLTSRFDPLAWWHQICTGPYSSDPKETLDKRSLVLVPLSKPYGALVPETLRCAGKALRLFGRGFERWLPDDLAPYVMPYDARLETLGRPGTQTDFAARALLDFVENVLPSASTLGAQRTAVSARMAAAATPEPIVPGRRLEDDDVRRIIRRLSARAPLGVSAMLRQLRRVEGVACEQGRFSRLYRETVK